MTICLAELDLSYWGAGHGRSRRSSSSARQASALLEQHPRGDVGEALRISGTATLGDEAFRQLSEERLEQARANLTRAERMATDYVPLAADEVRAVDTPTLLLNGAQSRARRQVLSEASGGNAAVYVYGVASLAQVEGDGFAWFLGDALGSVRQAAGDGATRPVIEEAYAEQQNGVPARDNERLSLAVAYLR